MENEIAERLQIEGDEEVVFTHKGVLHLPPEATLPTERCVRCGRKSVEVVTKPVRNPWNPISWYSPQTPVEIGLCAKHRDDRRIGMALMYSFLVVGFVFAFFGFAIGNLSMLIIGLVSMVGSGFFRARNVIHRTETSGESLKIKGAGSNFLKLFPAKSDSEIS